MYAIIVQDGRFPFLGYATHRVTALRRANISIHGVVRSRGFHYIISKAVSDAELCDRLGNSELKIYNVLLTERVKSPLNLLSDFIKFKIIYNVVFTKNLHFSLFFWV